MFEMERYNIYAEINGKRAFNLGLVDDLGFTIAEVERLNKNILKDEEIVYKYEEV